jgi:hypothetical protein
MSGLDFQITIWRGTLKEDFTKCRISLSIPDEIEDDVLFPTDPCEVFNTLHDCRENIQLRLFPTEARDGLEISGVKTTLPVSAITARVLSETLENLSSSLNLVVWRLVRGEGDDHAAEYGWDLDI